MNTFQHTKHTKEEANDKQHSKKKEKKSRWWEGQLCFLLLGKFNDGLLP
jgi:hypothetical protein